MAYFKICAKCDTKASINANECPKCKSKEFKKEEKCPECFGSGKVYDMSTGEYSICTKCNK
jgi:ribosomal protein L40E